MEGSSLHALELLDRQPTKLVFVIAGDRIGLAWTSLYASGSQR